MSPTDFTRLARRAEDTRTLAAGAVIFAAGDAGECLFVVRSGEVEIRVTGRTVERLGPGSIFGEMALLDDTTRSADAVAASDCEVVPIDRRRFLFLVQETPFFAIDVMRVLAQRLRRRE